MVKLPRIGRLKLPRLDAGNWRARLRAQRTWWRRRLRLLAGEAKIEAFLTDLAVHGKGTAAGQ